MLEIFNLPRFLNRTAILLDPTMYGKMTAETFDDVHNLPMGYQLFSFYSFVFYPLGKNLKCTYYLTRYVLRIYAIFS